MTANKRGRAVRAGRPGRTGELVAAGRRLPVLKSEAGASAPAHEAAWRGPLPVLSPWPLPEYGALEAGRLLPLLGARDLHPLARITMVSQDRTQTWFNGGWARRQMCLVTRSSAGERWRAPSPGASPPGDLQAGVVRALYRNANFSASDFYATPWEALETQIAGVGQLRLVTREEILRLLRALRMAAQARGQQQASPDLWAAGVRSLAVVRWAPAFHPSLGMPERGNAPWRLIFSVGVLRPEAEGARRPGHAADPRVCWVVARPGEPPSGRADEWNFTQANSPVEHSVKVLGRRVLRRVQSGQFRPELDVDAALLCLP